MLEFNFKTVIDMQRRKCLSDCNVSVKKNHYRYCMYIPLRKIITVTGISYADINFYI